MPLKLPDTGFKRENYAFLLVLVILVANVVINFLIINNNKRIIREMTEVIDPYVESLEEFKLLATESKMYATNWVYLRNSLEDKDALKLLHSKRFPELKKKLNRLVVNLGKKTDRDTLRAVYAQFQQLIKKEKEIMATLVTFDDYEDALKTFSAEELVEAEVLPRTSGIMRTINGTIQRNRKEADELKKEMEQASLRMMTIIGGVSLGICVMVIFFMYFISRAIRTPVLKMKHIISSLARGELPEEKINESHNVIGEMAGSVNVLSNSFTKTSHFAYEIEKGNLSAHYDKLSENDMLGNALIRMRESLKTYSEEMEEKVKERTREVIEKGVKLELAYREINDSISYAKRIQESILPADDVIRKAFSNSFIFYKPKAIVCGDFYWFSNKGDEVVIAAVDCTGHGVPGALMTVIGNSLLNQIVNFTGVTDPAKILTQLDKKLLETLQQHGTVTTNDGMDAAVIRYRISKKEITFSGAKRPMYLFKNGELVEIKGNKSPIGSFQYEFDKLYTEHRVTMHTGDTIYLFSDGFQDQFGGEDSKKFMVKRFRELLTEIQPMPMHEQLVRLEDVINTWQGQIEQTDDMLLIGVRF
ncbi:MAG: SpoIIE family protein phosphatase [Flavobacteriales bacterium]